MEFSMASGARNDQGDPLERRLGIWVLFFKKLIPDRRHDELIVAVIFCHSRVLCQPSFDLSPNVGRYLHSLTPRLWERSWMVLYLLRVVRVYSRSSPTRSESSIRHA